MSYTLPHARYATHAAVYNPTLRVPHCNLPTPYCSSGTLLDSRNTTLALSDFDPYGPPEPHAPNTLFSSCYDGGLGRYDSDEHIDAIYVGVPYPALVFGRYY